MLQLKLKVTFDDSHCYNKHLAGFRFIMTVFLDKRQTKIFELNIALLTLLNSIAKFGSTYRLTNILLITINVQSFYELSIYWFGFDYRTKQAKTILNISAILFILRIVKNIIFHHQVGFTYLVKIFF